MSKELWVEKYRPNTVDGYVWRDDNQRKQVNGWINSKSIPHVIDIWGDDIHHDWPTWRKMLPYILGNRE